MTESSNGRDIRTLDPASSHIKALDGIRGVAVLMVIAVHAYYRGPNVSDLPWLQNLLIFGWTGVELFFVLSGFLITSLIKDEITHPYGVRNFFIKRASRIFPLYFGILIILLISSFAPAPKIVADSLNNYRDNFAIYWIFANNFSELLSVDINAANKVLGPTWSLAIEQQYYLIWPLFLLVSPRRFAKYIPILAFIFMAIGRAHFASAFDTTVIYHATFFHADGILVGSMIALWLPDLIRIKKLLPTLLFISFMLMILIFFLAGTAHYSNQTVQTYGYAVISFFYGFVILHAITSKTTGDFFSHGLLLKAGKYAYFMYLVHWPILLALDQLPLPQGWISWCIFFLLFSISMIAAGSLSWNYYERPASRFIRSMLLKPNTPSNP